MSHLERNSDSSYPTASEDQVPLEPRSLAGTRTLVARRFAETLSLGDLAEAARMPANTLTRRFQRAHGLSPMRWLWDFRTYLAREIIAVAPEWSLTEIAVHCGFSSSAHFSRRYRAVFRIAPSAFRAAALRRQGSRQRFAPRSTVNPLVTRRTELVEWAFAALERDAELRRNHAANQGGTKMEP